MGYLLLLWDCMICVCGAMARYDIQGSFAASGIDVCVSLSRLNLHLSCDVMLLCSGSASPAGTTLAT